MDFATTKAGEYNVSITLGDRAQAVVCADGTVAEGLEGIGCLGGAPVCRADHEAEAYTAVACARGSVVCAASAADAVDPCGCCDDDLCTHIPAGSTAENGRAKAAAGCRPPDIMNSPTLIVINPDVTDTASSTVVGQGEEQRGRDIVTAGAPALITCVGRDIFGNARLVGGDSFNVTMHGIDHSEWYIMWKNGELELRMSDDLVREIGMNYVNGTIIDNQVGLGRIHLSRCTTAHPPHSRLTKIIGTSVAETICGRTLRHQDSSYTVTYNITVAGTFRMDALREGEHIKGSPYMTVVEPAETHAPTCIAQVRKPPRLPRSWASFSS